MIKVKNEKELLSLLRIVSSEAVNLSKRKLNENKDPSTSEYSYQKKMDEKLYGSLSEQEDEDPEAPEEADEPEEAPEEEPPPAEDSAEEEAPEEEGSSPEETGEVGASFDSVVKAVNNLRAGKSLRDSSIKQQAQNYYDKLSDPERTTLLVYLQALADIIAGQIDGKDAQDPSQPPVSLNITPDGEEAAPEETSDDQPEASEQEQEVPAPDAQLSDEEEDTTPPIRVNESQDLTALRKKVRRMMLRG
tara:strand:- start:1469 stop:2209 length:741 start_codon:yes stop_codon:yes gene_type:complete